MLLSHTLHIGLCFHMHTQLYLSLARLITKVFFRTKPTSRDAFFSSKSKHYMSGGRHFDRVWEIASHLLAYICRIIGNDMSSVCNLLPWAQLLPLAWCLFPGRGARSQNRCRWQLTGWDQRSHWRQIFQVTSTEEKKDNQSDKAVVMMTDREEDRQEWRKKVKEGSRKGIAEKERLRAM